MKIKYMLIYEYESVNYLQIFTNPKILGWLVRM